MSRPGFQLPEQQPCINLAIIYHHGQPLTRFGIVQPGLDPHWACAWWNRDSADLGYQVAQLPVLGGGIQKVLLGDDLPSGAERVHKQS